MSDPTMTTDLDRLEALVARLEAVAPGAAAATGIMPAAATDANGFPATVVAGDVIESAWGNAVRRKMLDFATGNPTHIATQIRFGNGVYPTNGNGDSLITMEPAFPTELMMFLAIDGTQGLPSPFILKFMNAASGPGTAIVRVFNHDGSIVASNGSVVVSWLAYGR